MLGGVAGAALCCTGVRPAENGRCSTCALNKTRCSVNNRIKLVYVFNVNDKHLISIGLLCIFFHQDIKICVSDAHPRND